MSAQTAKVEVLQAAVRVLMVGSRQVTLSVFRQLDHVERDDLQAFGRVRPDKEGGGIWLIGVRAGAGDLVRCWHEAPPEPQSVMEDRRIAPWQYIHWCCHQRQRESATDGVLAYNWDRPPGWLKSHRWTDAPPGSERYRILWLSGVLPSSADRPYDKGWCALASGLVNHTHSTHAPCTHKDDDLEVAWQEILNRQFDELRARHVAEQKWRAEYEQDATLPLIVLAGLR